MISLSYFAGGQSPRAQLRQLAPPCTSAFEEIRNDPDLALDWKRLIGVVPQAGRYGCHPIGLIN